MSTEPSLGELSRLVVRVETGLRDDIADLRKQINGLTYVDTRVWEAEKKVLETRLESLEQRAATQENHGRRLFYVVITAFLGPIIAGVILAQVLGGGV